MKSKMIWANFIVKDAKRTKQFYTQLGIKPNKLNSDPKLVGFLFGDDDFAINFFEQGSQIDEYLSTGSKNTNEVIFTLSAESEEEIKEWANKIKTLGGNIFQEAGRDETGHYSFGFEDPDGHRFNVLLMEEGM